MVDTFLHLVVKETLPKYDGMNDLIKDSLNHLYCSEGMRMVDRRRHFNSLLSKYEAFLKKLYYILNNHEMRPVLADHIAPTFMDALLSYSCLAGLRSNPKPVYQKFATYLELVKGWRNDESHEAGVSTEQELRAATHIVVAMYVFLVSQITGELEEVGAME